MFELVAGQATSVGVHVCGSIVDLAFDVGVEHFKERVDEHALRKSLVEFVEQHRKYNEVCSLAEEIDFDGLAQYIKSSLLKDVSNRVFNPNTKVRGKARNEIVSKAVAFSLAETAEAKVRVSRLVSIALDIIHDFYLKKISVKEWILASAVTDAVLDEVTDVVSDAEKTILNSVKTSEKIVADSVTVVKDELSAQMAAVDSTLQQISKAPFSLDTYYAMAANGNVGGVEDNLQLMSDIFSRHHPLYPDYGYKIFDNKLRTIPLTTEATRKYQPKFSCRGTVQMGGKTLSRIDESVIDYADRHQLDITLTVEEAEKLLGEIHDPDQTEAEALKGQIITRKPREFPPAFPCKLVVNGDVVYDYLEMRTAEILEDGTYVVDNREQENCPFRIQIRYMPLNRLTDEERNAAVKKLTYSFRMDNPSNKDAVKFIKMLKMASEGGSIELFALNLQKDILAGDADPFTYESEFKSIDEEIDFVERVCDIEDYLGQGIAVPERITENEYYQVLYISQIIRGDENEFTWSETSFKGIVDDLFRKRVGELEDEYHSMTFVGSSTAELFGIEFEIPIMREYKCCKIKDLERLKKKVELADNGDEITMTYLAGEDNTYIDKMKPDDFGVLETESEENHSFKR